MGENFQKVLSEESEDTSRHRPQGAVWTQPCWGAETAGTEAQIVSKSNQSFGNAFVEGKEVGRVDLANACPFRWC